MFSPLTRLLRPLRPSITVLLAATLALQLAGCAFGEAQATAQSTSDGTRPGAGASQAPRSATALPAATAIPPSPTPLPTPTPIPEPRDYAVAGGGWYSSVTGFSVRDDPAGPRFWAEYQRLGGTGTLGLPTSRPYDAPGDVRAQTFERGWLFGAPGKPAAQAGEGAPPPPAAEALAREDRPEMAFIGRVDVLPKQAKQGSTVVFRVWSPAARSATATIEGRNVPLVRDGEALIGLYGVYRLARPGSRPVRFTIVDAAGNRIVRDNPADTVEVMDAGYPTEDLVVDSATLGILDPVKINQEDALLNGIYGKWTPERRWRGPFVGPVGEVSLTSDYGTKRSINGIPQNWSHEGTDFDVQVGDLIQAAADGKVVFAGPLHVRGNVVVVDHGWGVMTGYFHMFQTNVQEGQDVKQGAVIGLVGSTGFVTGPHLHFEVRVHNTMVEPLEWLNRDPHQRSDLANL